MRVTGRSGPGGIPRRLILLLLLLGGARPAAAQRDSVTVVAGARYRAGELKSRLLGSEYRDLWTTPVRLPLLDLHGFAGGLTPVRKGGGHQTVSLRFRAANGREYNFRSVDKDVSRELPAWLKGSIVNQLLQDQTSSSHPAGAVVAAALLDSVGILNPDPQLVVMPDDPALGEFRQEFAGMLGTIEVHPDEGSDDQRLFAGAAKVVGSDRLLEHLEESPDQRADQRAYLRARLMDLFLGDWDRYESQYRWARHDSGGIHLYEPVPEDRDYVFVDYDGLLLRLAGKTYIPRAHPFTPEYRGDLVPLVISGQRMDRRLLDRLELATWDSVAAALRARLSDRVIAAAVRAMPPEYYARGGPELERILRGRRDRLPEVARRFYALLAAEAEVEATDEPESAEITRLPGGEVRVTLAPRDRPGAPFYQRTFRPGETREIRLYLHGGDDRAVVRGSARSSILVRVVGGGGDDVLADSSRVSREAVRTAFYDHRGANLFVRGPNTLVDRRDYDYSPPPPTALHLPPRDWGTEWSWFTGTADYQSGEGLILGGGPVFTRYGFRQHPYAYQLAVQGRVGLASLDAEASFRGDFRRVGSAQSLQVGLLASALDAMQFFGYGNDTPERPRAETLVQRRHYEASALYSWPLLPGATLAAGPLLSYTDFHVAPGTVLGEVNPYGAESFGQAGADARLVVDHVDRPAFPTSGWSLSARGTVFPRAWDARSAFGSLAAVATGHVQPGGERGPVLAARLGAERVFGRYPVAEAAFLGGSRSVRGYASRRFAGDASLYGNAEARLGLFPAHLLVGGTVGASALFDAGRVFVDGHSPGGWHTAVGGSLWFRTPGPVVALTYAHGEVNELYVRLGMPF